jgi:hypothetical protein
MVTPKPEERIPKSARAGSDIASKIAPATNPEISLNMTSPTKCRVY